MDQNRSEIARRDEKINELELSVKLLEQLKSDEAGKDLVSIGYLKICIAPKVLYSSNCIETKIFTSIVNGENKICSSSLFIQLLKNYRV